MDERRCGNAYLVHLVVELGVVLVDFTLFRVFKVPARMKRLANGFSSVQSIVDDEGLE